MTKTNNKEYTTGPWVRIGKLHKTRDFSTRRGKQVPTESLQQQVRKLAPHVTEISQVGVSPRTNRYLEKCLEKFVRKHRSYYTKKHRELLVSMEMLQASPCDIEGAEDFVIYIRSEVEDAE